MVIAATPVAVGLPTGGGISAAAVRLAVNAVKSMSEESSQPSIARLATDKAAPTSLLAFNIATTSKGFVGAVARIPPVPALELFKRAVRTSHFQTEPIARS